MDAADTNLLARIVLQDDDVQFELARKRMATVRARSERLFAPLTVFLELAWVIRMEAARAHGCAVLRTFDGDLAREPDADAV